MRIFASEHRNSVIRKYMDKREFERLLEEYKALRIKEQGKREDIRREFEREYERMESKIKDALRELPIKEA